MGCDGGTIPRRDELVRLKKKPEQVNNNKTFVKVHFTISIFMTSFRKTKMQSASTVGVTAHLLNKNFKNQS